MWLLKEVDQWTNLSGLLHYRISGPTIILSLTGMENLLESRNEDKVDFGNTLLPKFSIMLGKKFYPT